MRRVVGATVMRRTMVRRMMGMVVVLLEVNDTVVK
jgi:hypothetical protein